MEEALVWDPRALHLPPVDGTHGASLTVRHSDSGLNLPLPSPLRRQRQAFFICFIHSYCSSLCAAYCRMRIMWLRLTCRCSRVGISGTANEITGKWPVYIRGYIIFDEEVNFWPQLLPTFFFLPCNLKVKNY